jgi:hypothetical protein
MDIINLRKISFLVENSFKNVLNMFANFFFPIISTGDERTLRLFLQIQSVVFLLEVVMGEVTRPLLPQDPHSSLGGGRGGVRGGKEVHRPGRQQTEAHFRMGTEGSDPLISIDFWLV